MCAGRRGHGADDAAVRTTAPALEQWCGAQPASRVGLEVGTHSPWISRLLAEWGHEVLVAHAHQLRLISASPRKSDRVDAERLTRLGRRDPALLKPIHPRGAPRRPVAQADLAQRRGRDGLVRARTPLIHHVRGAVKRVGQRLPASSARRLPAPRATSSRRPCGRRSSPCSR
ncbi:MAG: hypothetical protein ACREOF_10535 [Gemmatimonadales bacterium]